MLDLPDYTASSPGPGEKVFHTSTSHMVHRYSIIYHDISSTPVQNSVLNECLNTKTKTPSVRGSTSHFFLQNFCQNSEYFKEFLPKFLLKFYPKKHVITTFATKKACECDICDKKEKKHPPAVTKCNVKIQNDPRGPKSDHKWPQMT